MQARDLALAQDPQQAQEEVGQVGPRLLCQAPPLRALGQVRPCLPVLVLDPVLLLTVLVQVLVRLALRPASPLQC